MEELIARLEKATGHDDALNFDIAVLQGWHPHRSIIDGEPWTTKWTTPSGETRHMCPWFTSSIDAALTLVPKGFQAYVDTGVDLGAAHSCVWIDCPHRIHGGAHGATPAIALCIAALKARKATGTTDTHRDSVNEQRA